MPGKTVRPPAVEEAPPEEAETVNESRPSRASPPKQLDEKVAALHLPSLGANLTKLSTEQADYIGVKVDGPFKQDTYRY